MRTNEAGGAADGGADAPPLASPPEPPSDCDRCPRLHAFLEVQREAHPSYFNRPVPSFGDPRARLLVAGMAPGLHGANATGRPFTGDGAGEFLYRALGEHGFARGTYARRPDDGLELVGAMITNAVRCVPPQNRPTGLEAATCRPFHAARLATLPRLRVVLTLGKIAHDSTVQALALRLKAHPFGHGRESELEGGVVLLSSYHTSRYNVNTGRLTYAMFSELMGRARELCG